MKMPFLGIGLSFAAGIALAAWIPSGAWLWGTLALLFLLLAALSGRRGFMPVLWAVFLVLGALKGQFDDRVLPSAIQVELQRTEADRNFAAVGNVVTEPQIKTRGKKRTASFIFETRFLESWPRTKRIRTREKIQVFLNQPALLPAPGDRLRLWGQLKPLEPVKNPSGFDYRRYLRRQDVGFVMNVYGAKSMRILKEGNRWDFTRLVSGVRNNIAFHIETVFKGEAAAFVKALVLGMRRDISNTRNNEFLKTGTSHLLAISGLNIALAAGSFYLLLIALRVPQKGAAAVSLVLTLIQVLVAGLGIPVQRAGLMAAAGFGALLLERERNGLNIFFLAFFILLWLDTRNLENISFQLSFLSLFCLMIFPRIFSISNPWLSGFISTAAVILGTFPIVIYHFSIFSPIGILANFLGIPLFHWTLLSAFLALLAGGIPFLGPALAHFSTRILSLGLGWIHLCSKAPWGYWFLVKPSAPQMVVYYLTLGIFLASLKVAPLKKRWIQAVFLTGWIVSFAVFFRSPVMHGFEMTLWAAGSNEIGHIQFGKSNHWLINAGRTFPGDQAQWIVTPYLRGLGLKNLKGILFTDWLKRHVSGLPSLQEQFYFNYLVYPWPGNKAQPPEAPQTGGAKQVFLGYGDKIRMPEGSSIEILQQARARFLFKITAGADFLFLYTPPNQDGQFLKTADVLVLSSEIAKSPEADLKRWIEKISPKVIISPVPVKTKMDLNLLWFDLATSGALKLRAENFAEQKWIQIQTMTGKTFEVPLVN